MPSSPGASAAASCGHPQRHSICPELRGTISLAGADPSLMLYAWPQVSRKEAPAEHRSVVRSTLFAAMHGAAQRLLEKKDFKELDTDGDGQVSRKELDSSLADMKVEGQDLEQARQQILQQADTDGDGVLSQEEFERAKAEVSKKQTSEYSEKKLLVRSILSGSYSDASKRLLRTKTFQEMDKDRMIKKNTTCRIMIKS